MLLSMTGFGDARAQNDRLAVSAEIRSVNNRHLKVSTRCPDAYAALENDVEKLIRTKVDRGTVSVTIRVNPLDGQSPFDVNADVLQQYWAQVRKLADQLHLPPPHDLSTLLQLPGVVCERVRGDVEPSDWPLLAQALQQALDRLHQFRIEEGKSMRNELTQLCRRVQAQAERIAVRAPLVIGEYRNRLRDRVGELLKGTGTQLADADLIREVSLFAERCDVNEELMRLSCHVEQFLTFLDAAESTGRRLDFLCQELFREVNTIGSKANDVEIAHDVVEVKALIEKMREIVQNIE